jgi:glycine/D-amino acid oxidase-like deaminating enzyme
MGRPPVLLDQTGVLWVDRLPEPLLPLSGRAEADVAILGGGYTGLCTALSLAERLPGKRLVVVEAGVCGGGASGRNAGMALPGAGVDLDGLEARLGSERAHRALLWMRRGLDRLVERLKSLPGAGPWESVGSLALGRTPRHTAEQKRLLATYRRHGLEAEILEGEALRREIDAPACRSAFHVPAGAVLVQPWNLAQALKSAALAAKVTIHEQTGVEAIRTGKTITLHAPEGTLTASRLVLAANAWAPSLGFLRHRVAPVHVSCIATAPLPASTLEALRWKRRQAVWEEGRLYHFLRLTPDNRVLIGGGSVSYRFGGSLVFDGRSAWRRLEKALPRILPALEGVEVTHRWSGPVDFTRDFLPSFGVASRERNIFYALGYTGHGVALSHLAGEVLAGLAAGDTTTPGPEAFLVNRPLPTVGTEPLRYLTVNAVRNGWMALDRLGL